MKVLYITYIDFGELNSGSSVRPQRMYDAFCELGYDVYLVSGLQNRRTERKNNIKKAIKWLENNKPDFCYIEPPSCPIYADFDRKFINKVHKLGIPCAVFYRDAHWLFADWWGVKGVKAAFLRYLHKKDLKTFINCCDKIYFPSLSMMKLFNGIDVDKCDVLPPACEKVIENHKDLSYTMLYVGGISKAYGTDILLKAFEIVNDSYKKIKLVVCCRESELANLPDQRFDYDFLEIIHKSGDELQDYYSKADCGIIPLRRDKYMDFAIPVKLFEYMGNGLPVIATDCPEIAGFINKNLCGSVCKADAESMAEAVIEFYSNEENRSNLIKNTGIVAGKNRWVDRVQKISDDLVKF